MPKKKKTHSAKETNWVGRLRESILYERMAPILLSLAPLLRPSVDDNNIMAVMDFDTRAIDLDGVVGQSSA